MAVLACQVTSAHTHASTRQVSGVPRRAVPHALGLATDAPAQYVVAAGTIQTVVRIRGMARGTAADATTCVATRPVRETLYPESDVVAVGGWGLAGGGLMGGRDLCERLSNSLQS